MANPRKKMATPEYKALTQCYPTLVLCIQQSPNSIADQLKPYGVLSPEDEGFIRNHVHEDSQKARRLLGAVLSQVQIDPKIYQTFIEALKKAGGFTRASVNELETTYNTPTSAQATRITNEATASTADQLKKVQQQQNDLDKRYQEVIEMEKKQNVEDLIKMITSWEKTQQLFKQHLCKSRGFDLKPESIYKDLVQFSEIIPGIQMTKYEIDSVFTKMKETELYIEYSKDMTKYLGQLKTGFRELDTLQVAADSLVSESKELEAMIQSLPTQDEETFARQLETCRRKAQTYTQYKERLLSTLSGPFQLCLEQISLTTDSESAALLKTDLIVRVCQIGTPSDTETVKGWVNQTIKGTVSIRQNLIAYQQNVVKQTTAEGMMRAAAQPKTAAGQVMGNMFSRMVPFTQVIPEMKKAQAQQQLCENCLQHLQAIMGDLDRLSKELQEQIKALENC